MSVTIGKQSGYENKFAWARGENKANSNSSLVAREAYLVLGKGAKEKLGERTANPELSTTGILNIEQAISNVEGYLRVHSW
ncbi:MAG: hypothetical protein PVJ86_14225 [Phycisphaerales bacterium]|jgi:hypothetical protein